MRAFIFAAIVLALPCTGVVADTCLMKDGRLFEGNITAEDATSVTIERVVGGIPVTLKIKREEIAEINKGASASDPVSPPTSAPALDPETQARVDNLKHEVEGLRNQQTEYQKQLRNTPRTTNTHRVQPGETLGDMFRSQNRGPEPNPAYAELEEQIRKTKEAITTKTKEISNLISDPSYREAATNAAKAAEKERAEVMADLKKRFADPTVVADQSVGVLYDSKVILEVAVASGTEQIPLRKAMLYKALLLNLSTAAQDSVAVARARPDTDFLVVNYKFKFETKAGLLRSAQGYVLLCQIDQVWWPVQINVDGISSYWESFQHPLVTPSLFDQYAAKFLGHRVAEQGRVFVKMPGRAPTSQPTPSPNIRK